MVLIATSLVDPVKDGEVTIIMQKVVMLSGLKTVVWFTVLKKSSIPSIVLQHGPLRFVSMSKRQNKNDDIEVCSAGLT